MRIFVHPLWVNSLNLNNNNGKSAGQKLGQTDTQWTNTMAHPPFQWEKKKEKSLNWPRNFRLSTSIIAQSPCLAGTIWLDPLTVTCMCIICRGHTLCSGSCMLQGERESGGGGELTCTGWQHTLGRGAGIAGSTAALGHRYSPRSVRLRTEEPEGARREGNES